MPLLLGLLSPLVALVAIDVTQLDGTVVSGQLVRWNDQQIVLQTEDEPIELSTEQVLGMKFRDGLSRPTKRGKQVTLRCGSVIPVVDFTTADGRANLRIESDPQPLNIDVGEIQAVRFRPPSPALDEQWRQLVTQKHEGDVIVIHKSDDALDYLEGIVGNVTAKQLVFELDGEQLEVALAKLEGIIPFRNATTRTRAAQGNLTTTDGAVWKIEQANLGDRDDAVQVRTPSGLTTRVSLDRIRQVDFAAGKVQYLGDLEPIRVETVPLVSSDATPDSLIQFLYAPRQNQSLQGTPLTLIDADGKRQTFAKGLAVHSKTELQYALDGEYRQLRGLCGIDPSVPSEAVVSLKIFADDKIVFEQSINAGSEPVSLALAVDGARRLRLVVDYADGSDLGDHLHLCNLRVTK